MYRGHSHCSFPSLLDPCPLCSSPPPLLLPTKMNGYCSLCMGVGHSPQQGLSPTLPKNSLILPYSQSTVKRDGDCVPFLHPHKDTIFNNDAGKTGYLYVEEYWFIALTMHKISNPGIQKHSWKCHNGAHCIRCSPVAVIKHHDQGTYRRKFVLVMVTESWNS